MRYFIQDDLLFYIVVNIDTEKVERLKGRDPGGVECQFLNANKWRGGGVKEYSSAIYSISFLI